MTVILTRVESGCPPGLEERQQILQLFPLSCVGVASLKLKELLAIRELTRGGIRGCCRPPNTIQKQPKEQIKTSPAL